MYLLNANNGYGHPTARTLMQSITKSDMWCRDKSIMPGSTVLTTLSNLSQSGIASPRETSSTLFDIGVFCSTTCTCSENGGHFEHTLLSHETSLLWYKFMLVHISKTMKGRLLQFAAYTLTYFGDTSVGTQCMIGHYWAATIHNSVSITIPHRLR